MNRAGRRAWPSAIGAMWAVLFTVSCGSVARQGEPGSTAAPLGSESASTSTSLAVIAPDTVSKPAVSESRSDVRWVGFSVGAYVDDPMTLGCSFDACVPDGVHLLVIESDTEVRLRTDKQHDYAGPQLLCGEAGFVQLAQPLGSRQVIDDHTGLGVFVDLGVRPPVPTEPQPFAGRVRDVLGQEGDATVTGWLLVDQTGAAELCDDLPPTALTCPTPTIAVDWTYGGASRPSDLVQRGPVRVSTGPITLRGSLKIYILYVGIVP